MLSSNWTQDGVNSSQSFSLFSLFFIMSSLEVDFVFCFFLNRTDLNSFKHISYFSDKCNR